MKPLKINRSPRSSGYLQFWKDQKPPTLVVTRFPKPDLPLRLLTRVSPRGDYVEFFYDLKSTPPGP